MTGLFPYYGGGILSPFQGAVYSIYETGLIISFFSTGIEVYSFEKQTKQLYTIANYNQKTHMYLDDAKGFLMYDLAKDQVFFKQTPQTEYLFLKGQTGILFNSAMINPNYIFILTKFGAYVCDSKLMFRNITAILSQDCTPQNTSIFLIKYSFPSKNTNFKSDSLLVFHQNAQAVLLIYDYSQGPQNIALVYGKFNTTLNYKYVGERKFILLNHNGQISLLTIPLSGQVTEKSTLPLTSYIFYLSFGFQVLSDKIIIVNSKQALSIKFNLENSPIETIPYSNFEHFLSSERNNFEIQPFFGDEPVTNYDYVIRVYYDYNLELYVILKNYSVHIKYQQKHINKMNERMIQFELNSSRIMESVYVETSKKLVALTITEQIVIDIPAMVVVRRDKLNIFVEKYVIYQKNFLVITCVMERDNYFQYLSVDVDQNTSFISEVYLNIQDYFVGYDQVVLLNKTDFQVITLSTNKIIKGSPGFSLTFQSNIFYETSTTSYLALFKNLNSLQQMLIYNMGSSSFTKPELTLTFPSVVFVNQMFDYYQNVCSLYLMQPDGIYTYEVDENNVFIQKSYYKNIVIQTFKLNSKVPGPQLISKVLVYQASQGVIVVDKITKTFSFISSQLQISNVYLLPNQRLQEELLIIQSQSETIVYQYINNQYKVMTNIQSSCEKLRYLDSSEISCYQPLKNDTQLIPIKNSHVLQIINYDSSSITNLVWDQNNQNIIVTINNSILKVLDYNLEEEQIFFSQQQVGDSIQYICFDPSQQLHLYIINKNALWSSKQGAVTPQLILNQNIQIAWYFVAQDKSIILLNLQGQFYSINYSTNKIIFIEDILSKDIIPPAQITLFDRQENNIYILFARQKIINFSFTKGIQSIVSLAGQEIFLSAKRIDGQVLLLTNTQITNYDQITLNSLKTQIYSTSTESYKILEISKSYIFCQPTALKEGYLININTLEITVIAFNQILNAIDFDMKNLKMGAFTVDNMLTIYDIFTKKSVGFILQEFSDNLQSDQNQDTKVILRVIIDLDCAIISQAQNIYIYSISRKGVINVIRKNSKLSILNYYIINMNVIMCYDQSAIYFFNLHSILQMQYFFYNAKYRLKEIQVYKNQSNKESFLIQNIFTSQFKKFNILNGEQMSQYQLRKSFFIPQLINSELSYAIYSSNSKIIIKQETIFIIDDQNQIVDSLYIKEMNAIAPLTQNILNDNLIYVINIDGSIIEVDLKKKTNKLLSIKLNNIVFIVEFTNTSFIFQYKEGDKQNSLMCFDSKTLSYNDMTSTLVSFNIQRIMINYQKINETSFISLSSDGFLYEFNFSGCKFQGIPILRLSQKISSYFYDPHLQFLFVQQKGRQQLELIQNGYLIKTSMFLPSYTNNKYKISNDQSFYILFSNLFISIYYSSDIKLKVSIQQLISQSEIQDVTMVSPEILIVVTNTEIISFNLIEDNYFQTFFYSIQMPTIISYKVITDYLQQSQAILVDVSIFSEQGIIRLNLPIFQDVQASSRKCFYKLDLNPKNKSTNSLISDKIQTLKFLNKYSNNIQVLNSLIFNIGEMESLQKLSEIPSNINNLVLDTNNMTSRIVIDQFFITMNLISSNVFLRNAILVSLENNSNSQVEGINLQISNKRTVYLQNISLEGVQQSYYFTFDTINLFKIQKMNIIKIQFGVLKKPQPQMSDNIALFNLKGIQFINIQYLHIKDIVWLNDFVLFNIQGATKITIKNLTIENINCKSLTLFSIKSSIEVVINQIIVNNMNCTQFQLIYSNLVTSISLENIQLSLVNSSSVQPIIKVQSISSFTLNNLKINLCQGLKILSIEKFVQNDIIYTVKDVKIKNISITQYFDLNVSQLTSRLLQVDPLSEYKYFVFSIIDCKNLEILNFDVNNLNLSSYFIILDSENINLNNLTMNYISTINKQIFSLISIQGRSVTLSKFTKIDTSNIVVKIENTAKLDLIQLKYKGNSLQSEQLVNGLLNILNVDIVSFNDCHFENNSLFNLATGLINMNNVNKFLLIKSEFIKNSSSQSSGTCLYVIQIKLLSVEQINVNPSLIDFCNFIENESVQGYGGAIYISEQNISIQNSVFKRNKALIGGAIKIDSFIVLPEFFKNNMLNKQNSNQFQNNYASLYGQNIGYFPQKVIIEQKEKNNEENEEKMIKIKNFQSNNYIDNLILKILDNEGEFIRFPSVKLNQQNLMVQQEFLKYQFAIEQKQMDNLFVSQSQILLIEQSYFQLNATIIIAPNATNTLVIKSSGTIPTIQVNQSGVFVIDQVIFFIFLSYSQIKLKKYMETSFSIQSRGCQRGDYISVISDLTYCMPCPFGQYSLSVLSVQDSKQSTVLCKNCPNSAISCQGNDIQLKNGFWREDSNSDDIYMCELYMSSCMAEDKLSRNLCGQGFVGPLCDTCDSQGVVWGERYVLSSSNSRCSVCPKIIIQLIQIIGLFTLTVGYLVFIVFQNIRCSQNKILRQYSQRLIGISLGCGIDLSRNSVLIKIFMNFVQIYMILNGLGFSFPHQYSTLFITGDPTINLVYSTNCMWNSQDKQMLIIFPILFKIISVIILYLVCLAFIVSQYYFDNSKSKKISYQITYCSMAAKMIFIYGGYGIVGDAMKALTCLQIGSKSYRSFDKRVECSSVNEDYLIYIFAVIVVFIIVILIPTILLINIRQFSKNKQTHSIQVIKSYNFLFQEYKEQAAYWEVVKIMLKYSIIFVINFSESNKFVKIQLAILFLILYNILVIKIQPYKSQSFNNSDVSSILTCLITLVCISCILSTNNQIIQYILLIIIITINTFFLFGLIFQYLKGLRLDEQTKNPLKVIMNKSLIRLLSFLKIKRSLKLWMILKRKITGNTSNEFIESLQKSIKETRLVKSKNVSSQFYEQPYQKKNQQKQALKRRFTKDGNTLLYQRSSLNQEEDFKQIKLLSEASPTFMQTDTLQFSQQDSLLVKDKIKQEIYENTVNNKQKNIFKIQQKLNNYKNMKLEENESEQFVNEENSSIKLYFSQVTKQNSILAFQ